MKFLTIRQPWASLISLGVKRIETRSWSTSFRGPLAIHAGKAKPSRDLVRMGQWLTRWDYGEGRYAMSDGLGKWVALPLGAVVAVCDLIDVVPIVDDYEAICDAYEGPAAIERTPSDMLIAFPAWSGALDEDAEMIVTEELPFGDFTAGRWAWLLGPVKPLPDPIPMRGAQGLRDLPTDVADVIKEQIG